MPPDRLAFPSLLKTLRPANQQTISPCEPTNTSPREPTNNFARVTAALLGARAMNPTDFIDKDSLRSDVPNFGPGDNVKVHVRVIEGNKERTQVFQGYVIARAGGGVRETFTVQKISYGVGVERTFPVHSPTIAQIEVMSRGDVRRAKLYYLRNLRGKAAKVKEKR